MDRAIALALTEKKPVPEIDFTLHTMEDGTQVSTMERVIKGETQRCCLGLFEIFALTILRPFRGTSAGVTDADGRTVLVS
jgi:hypothetical protein